jgi:hypothetical protein
VLKGFSFENVNFRKDNSEDLLIVSGEVTNKTGRDYSSVVFRLIVFAKDIPLGHTLVTINGFGNGRMKRFERRFESLIYSQVNTKISNYETTFEGGY